MPYRVGLKDERPTSNFQLPTSNKKQKYKTEHSRTPWRGRFLGSGSTIFMIHTDYSNRLSCRSDVCWFILSHLKLDVGRSMLDVLNFYSLLGKNNLALMGINPATT
jgi:hypothetical protein